jgi:hypothetical protein
VPLEEVADRFDRLRDDTPVRDPLAGFVRGTCGSNPLMFGSSL